MNNKCCRIVDQNESFFFTEKVDIDDYRDFLWDNMYRVRQDDNILAGWEPIVLYQGEGYSAYRPLAPPRNTGLVTFDPLNCTNDQFITDPTRVADPKSASIDCQYCEDFGNDIGAPEGNSELGDANGNRVSTGSYSCCNGNCDVRTNQADIEHNIPYVLPQYVNQWADDSYKLKWPDIYTGTEVSDVKGVQRTAAHYQDRYCRWEILPTMGEIPYDVSTSQYNSKRDHELAIEKASQANRMAGNFIVFQIGPQALFDDNQDAVDWYKDQIKPCLGEFGYINRFKDVVDVDLPTPEEFTVPYGFNDGTQNNVFIGRKKRTSWWKWRMEECPVAWGLKASQYQPDYMQEEYVDADGETQTRETNQWDHQFWIPPGDIWIAKIQPDEPKNNMQDGKTEQDGQQRCPSGVKFMESGNMYVLPHETYALYVSCNMYDRFYEAYQSIKEIPEVRPQDRIMQAMYAATHPLIDKITVNLHKPYTINTEIKEYYSTLPQNQDNEFNPYPVTSRRTEKGQFANPYYQFMNWFDKKYMTSSNLNLVDSNKDLWNTLVSKYGSYYASYDAFFNKTIEFDNQTLPPNTHLGVDIIYDFTVASDRRINGRRQQPDRTDYSSMTNAGLNSQFTVGGWRDKERQCN